MAGFLEPAVVQPLEHVDDSQLQQGPGAVERQVVTGCVVIGLFEGRGRRFQCSCPAPPDRSATTPGTPSRSGRRLARRPTLIGRTPSRRSGRCGRVPPRIRRSLSRAACDRRRVRLAPQSLQVVLGVVEAAGVDHGVDEVEAHLGGRRWDRPLKRGSGGLPPGPRRGCPASAQVDSSTRSALNRTPVTCSESPAPRRRQATPPQAARRAASQPQFGSVPASPAPSARLAAAWQSSSPELRDGASPASPTDLAQMTRRSSGSRPPWTASTVRAWRNRYTPPVRVDQLRPGCLAECDRSRPPAGIAGRRPRRASRTGGPSTAA